MHRLVVERPRAHSTSSGSRVTTRVDGVDLWFESPDVTLRPSAEALVAALLIPALAQGASLEIRALVAADFAANAGRVLDLVHRWWRYPPVWPKLNTRSVDAVPHPLARSALCFSAGVDSFFTLLESGRHVDSLVFVHGFDVPLTDVARAEGCERALREVADATGARAILVRTNLREHPSFQGAPWDHAHGGALAAVGHLLADHCSTLLVSSSNALSQPKPWGSHWELDPLWGGAGLGVEHVGAESTRMAKIAAIAHHPLVQRHLRVCWENRDVRLNCSRCEKCIRTRIGLLLAGALERFTVFEPAPTLVGRVEALRFIRDPVQFERYEAAVERGLPQHLEAAVLRLLARSRRELWRRRLTTVRSRGRRAVQRIFPRLVPPSVGELS